MARKTKVIEKAPADFGDFIICNHEKLDRVINGTMGAGGTLHGGLGKDASADAILAEYDKLAGTIRTKDGVKVETGSFWDFENKCARKEPLIKLAKSPNTAGLKINTEEVGDKESKKGRGKKKQIEEE